MALISLHDVSFGYSSFLLLEKVSLYIERKDRICLLGRNGEGKTTLINLINGKVKQDTGEVIFSRGVTTACLHQNISSDLDKTVFDIVADRLAETADMYQNKDRNGDLELKLKDKNILSEKIAFENNGSGDLYRIQNRVERIISQLQFDPDKKFINLSAGQKRIVLFAKAVAKNPDVLLLDEPTNHLDIKAIKQLEQVISGFKGALLFVSHDRMFLKKNATRIIELDRGSITNWHCDYETYLKRKQNNIEVENKQNALFDKKLNIEEKWLRKGVKARRTRNEGRVKSLNRLRELRQKRREQIKNANIAAQGAEASGKLVVKANDIGISFGDNKVIRSFSTLIMRGDKVGIIGPNGSGKTTLVRLLIGELSPQKGKIRFGVKLKISYFDQLRQQLCEEKSVQDNIAGGNDTIIFNGKAKHVISYLKDFLFSPERARSPVKTLSGGERNRLLLARMFTQPSNVLVLDEPTNDLDIETLELLEKLLADFMGTVFLVSHDREFLNNVVTSTIVFEENGMINEYVGGYDDWLWQAKKAKENEKDKDRARPKKNNKKPTDNFNKNGNKIYKLTYNEQRELTDLPEYIEKLEAEQTNLNELMCNPDFFKRKGDEISLSVEKVKKNESELKTAYQRWEFLETHNH